MQPLPQPRLAFVYGSREMLRGGIYPSFAQEAGAIGETFRRCDDYIRARLGWSLEQALGGPDGRAPQHMVDPTLTAVQLALTDGWRSRGIEPDAIAARSGGEFAAEYARGALSLEDALEVACRWSVVQHQRRGAGTLLMVHAGLRRTDELRRASPAPFHIAADAGEEITVIACTAQSVPALQEFLSAQGAGHERTDLTFAPHSPLIDAWRQAFLEPPLRSVAPSPVPYYSAGAQVPDAGTPHATRMWRSVRAPTLMVRTLHRMVEDGCNIFLQIGARPMLIASVLRDAAKGRRLGALPTMVPELDLRTSMDKTQGMLRQLGVREAQPRR
jgi:acyl transferase domain-containing protein